MRKDVVIAEIGAAAAFVGFVLVFLGVVITSYQTLLGQIADTRLAPFKRAGWISIFAMVLGLVSVVVSTSWLIVGGGRTFYIATLVVFFAELVALVVAAASTVNRLLR
jgi:hypothetical protein